MEHVNMLSLRFMRDAIKMAGIKSINGSMPLPVWLPLHEKLLQAFGPGEDSVFEGMEYELLRVPMDFRLKAC